jgi:hypothetical protein
MPEDDTPTEWVEVNIEPTSYERRERLLLDVIDPLIHETLSGRIDAWHYFWEPALSSGCAFAGSSRRRPTTPG